MERYVECGVSGQSTPHSHRDSPRAAVKRAGTPSSASSLSRPLSGHQISTFLNYGSEEDSDSEDEDEDRVPVPRARRVLGEDANVDECSKDGHVSYQWPPRFEPEPTVKAEAALEPEPAPELKQEKAMYGPEQKFQFDWRAFPQPQIPPELRREPFSEINCGPTVPLANPYDAFTAIWDCNILEHIVLETNRYAQQLAAGMVVDRTIHPRSRITSWKDTSVDELYVFFALILTTGIVVKTRLEEYWNSDKDIFSTPGFSASMSITRFQLLSKCLHFTDNDGCDPELMTRKQAKLFKIQPILIQLNHKFSQLYNLSQNIALDESLTMWKGWLDFKQFINNKVASVGLKTYEICESHTGYLWRFLVHAGHETSDVQDPELVSGTVPAVVLKLLDGLEHNGHTVWMDNFYNSPALARELKSQGFDCVGTLRTNRKYVPKELSNLSKSDMAIGQVCGCTSEDVDLVVWRDKNLVTLISTYHGLASVKCGDTVKPSIVADYNICMGGVDRKDQMLAMYPIERERTRVWYKKLFRRLLNASVLNAYILHKTQHTITHRTFRRTLVKELLTRHATPTPTTSLALPPAGHFPGQYDFVGGKQHERQRRVCVVCKQRTTAYCKACNVPLCVFTCFEPHHTPQRH